MKTSLVIGEPLPNGSILLAAKPTRSPADDGKFWFVLGFTGEDAGMPYVTWMSDAKGNTFWGHYNKTRAEGMKDFEGR